MATQSFAHNKIQEVVASSKWQNLFPHEKPYFYSPVKMKRQCLMAVKVCKKQEIFDFIAHPNSDDA